MYIYIYICICVCVNRNYMHRHSYRNHFVQYINNYISFLSVSEFQQLYLIYEKSIIYLVQGEKRKRVKWLPRHAIRIYTLPQKFPKKKKNTHTHIIIEKMYIYSLINEIYISRKTTCPDPPYEIISHTTDNYSFLSHSTNSNSFISQLRKIHNTPHPSRKAKQSIRSYNTLFTNTLPPTTSNIYDNIVYYK